MASRINQGLTAVRTRNALKLFRPRRRFLAAALLKHWLLATSAAALCVVALRALFGSFDIYAAKLSLGFVAAAIKFAYEVWSSLRTYQLSAMEFDFSREKSRRRKLQ